MHRSQVVTGWWKLYITRGRCELPAIDALAGPPQPHQAHNIATWRQTTVASMSSKPVPQTDPLQREAMHAVWLGNAVRYCAAPYPALVRHPRP